ncbi:HDOD domain-containing protein [bacterium]|nr:HDOD domain-containing protein [bacterium]
MEQDKLKKVIQSISDVPTLPTVVARVMQILNDPYSSASDLTEVVSVDQAMTFRILKMANSAFYGFPRAVSTVTESVVLLGFSTVRNLILTTMMYNFDQIWNEKTKVKKSDQKIFFNQRQEWKHAVATAIMTRELLVSQQLKSLEQVGFLAGLMHDVGKTLFYHYFHDEYYAVLKNGVVEGRELCRREERKMGAHHGQVGAWIVDRWNLPEEIVTPIACHHFPEEAKEQKELTNVLYIANRMACATLKENSQEDILHSDEIITQWWNQLGLEQKQIEKMEEKLRQELEEIESFMTV